MEITWLSGRAGYIRASVNIGVIRTDDDGAILIDTGIDDAAARRIHACVVAAGLTVRAVVNTHAHADHVGGNQAMRRLADVPFHAPELEKPLCEAPIYEPLYLSAGAMPLPEMTGKFLLAQPSPIDIAIRQARHRLEIAGVTLEMVPLPGHSPGQMGVSVDGVLYAADAIFSTVVLEKHRIPFLVDSVRQAETLTMIGASRAAWIVPSHSDAVQDASPMVEAYRTFLRSLEAHLMGELQSRRTESDLIRSACRHFNVRLTSMPQHALTRTPVLAVLHGLVEKGLAAFVFDQNLLWWHAR